MEPNNTHFIRCLETLKDSPFFSAMPTLTLRTLLCGMKHEKWTVGSCDEKNNLVDRFHIILSGRLKVYRINPATNRQHTTFLLERGDVFDFMNLFDPDPHEVYFQALDPLEVVSLPIAAMRSWMEANPQIHRNIITYMLKRMRQLDSLKTDYALYQTSVRLANLILQNINLQSRTLEHINNLPNHEIASLLGTTRAVVNRHIQELKKSGAISVIRGQITIGNIDQLLAAAKANS